MGHALPAQGASVSELFADLIDRIERAPYRTVPPSDSERLERASIVFRLRALELSAARVLGGRR